MSSGEGQCENSCEEGLAESAPLLATSPDNGDDGKQKDHSTLLWKIYMVVFFCNLGFQILQPAQTQIYETIYCSEWYRRHPIDLLPSPTGKIPESYCKIGPVQTQISTLKGWYEFFAAAPGLVMAIPMGILTDAVGRRHLMILNITILCLGQVWVTFVTWFDGKIPLRAIWAGAGLNIVNGGIIVTELLFVCVLTDISPSDRVVETFFRSTAFGHFAKVLGPVIAATLMRRDPWLAIYLGLALLGMTVMLVATVPETLHMQVAARNDQAEGQGDQTTTTCADSRGDSIIRSRWRQLNLGRLIKIWSDWRLIFVALTYPFRLVCYALSDLLQRYVSDRYGWTLADATLVYSLQAVAAGLVLFTLLPWISARIDARFAFSTIQKNVVLARTSLFVLVVAYAVIGLAPNPAVMIIGLLIETLSTGFPATLRALAAALIDADDKGRVFSVLAIVETLSIMLAYPVTAALFNAGLDRGGGPWLGLPYDVISVAAALACVTMCLVRFERPVRIV
ncbi:uncharacterized protein Z520_00210 [Fonsecaea multimorphosa CBS 102226]|uniref:Major facilitator superfamily (MFS) profile domain-containing protein n=1 Tax=Fonsecaea multimorphosa CBS 102226 TaxID=1442371 RepID=A0A0D2L385_9EURO|nr:uncharacterized protein Z520_00210 [Fonsecaea multimorphosa CBS 102226]KIY03519.1 hypothetical protein Z520_00210 [Fonsecaea multimorphosa CBS 102226]OAL32635.1 hypothetical protein AYO22_00248 [Fonsecaea multimorphosa]